MPLFFKPTKRECALNWLRELKVETNTMVTTDFRGGEYLEVVARVLVLCKPDYIKNALDVLEES